MRRNCGCVGAFVFRICCAVRWPQNEGFVVMVVHKLCRTQRLPPRWGHANGCAKWRWTLQLQHAWCVFYPCPLSESHIDATRRTRRKLTRALGRDQLLSNANARLLSACWSWCLGSAAIRFVRMVRSVCVHLKCKYDDNNRCVCVCDRYALCGWTKTHTHIQRKLNISWYSGFHRSTIAAMRKSR